MCHDVFERDAGVAKEVTVISGERLREHGLLASFYFVAVGALYLWGYWSSFEINILEYISLTDIVKVTVIPIISSFIAVTAGAILGELITSPGFPPGAGANTPEGRFLNNYKFLLLGAYCILTLLIYFLGPVQKWIILPGLISLPIWVMLRNQRFLEDLIPNDSVNRITVLLLCMLPFYAYGHGIMNADKIITGSDYKYVELQIKKFAVGTSANENEYEKLKFLGFMNNFVFLMPIEGKTVIVTKFDNVDPMALKAYTKPK